LRTFISKNFRSRENTWSSVRLCGEVITFREAEVEPFSLRKLVDNERSHIESVLLFHIDWQMAVKV
jgi:hypothetical protein